MKKKHSFGGDWTEDKLKRINKYLKAYTKIFAANQKAQFLTTIYVDAFASTGDRASDARNSEGTQSDVDASKAEVRKFLDGSVRIALEVRPEFDQYLFVELDAEHCQELEAILLLRILI